MPPGSQSLQGALWQSLHGGESLPGRSILALAALVGAVASGTAAHAQTAADLRDLSLEELGSLDVTSVFKRPEPLQQAPAAIYVIGHDTVVRSAATNLAEVLRLAPNLHVSRTNGSRYVVSARGLNGNTQAQNFSNKLLVMIDGRSVYTPLFSGVYWDMQDVMLEDVDRIEVISGPGGTLWGANAVNGVINVTTRSAHETQGLLVSAIAGGQVRTAAARYGGKVGEAVSYRAYVRAYEDDEMETATGADLREDWSRVQGGFRVDWAATESDAVTFQGDVHEGESEQGVGRDDEFRGQNLLARWVHTGAGGRETRVQAYYDRAHRGATTDGKFRVQTLDAEVQHAFQLGERHAVVVGGGLRQVDYRIDYTPVLDFVPSRRTLNLAAAFVQDTITITPDVRLTLGLKIEDDPYVKAKPLYNARLAWTPDPTTTVWAAVSTAVRAPTPFDRDVVERVGGQVFLVGNPNFEHVDLTAYEAGLRWQAATSLSLSMSLFYNEYRGLRNIEITPPTLIPLYWGNGIDGNTLGLDAWGEYRPTPWWRLAFGYSYLEKHLDFKPGASQILGAFQAGNDPRHRATLRSSMDLGDRVTLDADFRYQSRLPNPGLAAYAELDVRLGFLVTNQLELAISGRNLLHEHHEEFSPGGSIPRSFHAGLMWRF